MVEDLGRVKIALKDIPMEVVSSPTAYRLGLDDSVQNGVMILASQGLDADDGPGFGFVVSLAFVLGEVFQQWITESCCLCLHSLEFLDSTKA